MAAGTGTAVRRVLLLFIDPGSFSLHIKIVALEDHLLFNHVRLREIGAVFVEVRVGIGTTVVTLELKIWIGRSGIGRPRVRIERHPHLIFMLVLFGHLFERLGGRAEFSLAKVNVGVGRHPILGDASLALKHRRRVIVLIGHQRTMRGFRAVRHRLLQIFDVFDFQTVNTRVNLGFVLEIEVFHQLGIVTNIRDEIVERVVGVFAYEVG